MIPRCKVLVTRSVPYLVSALKARAPNVEFDVYEEAGKHITRDELLKRVQGCTGLLCLLTDGPIDDAVLDAAGAGLKVVSTLSVGHNHIDVAACRARGVAVGNTPGVLDEATAELGVALTLAAARRVPQASASVADGTWGTWTPFEYCGAGLSRATVGVAGMGRIGATYARMMAGGFDAKILYWPVHAKIPCRALAI